MTDHTYSLFIEKFDICAKREGYHTLWFQVSKILKLISRFWILRNRKYFAFLNNFDFSSMFSTTFFSVLRNTKHFFVWQGWEACFLMDRKKTEVQNSLVFEPKTFFFFRSCVKIMHNFNARALQYSSISLENSPENTYDLTFHVWC